MRLLPMGLLLSVALLSLWISTMTGSGYSGPTLLTDGRTSQSWTSLRATSAQELAVPAPTAGTRAPAGDASLTATDDVTEDTPGADGLVLAQPEAVVPGADGKTAIELATGDPPPLAHGDVPGALLKHRIHRDDAPASPPDASGTSAAAGWTSATVLAPSSTAIPAATSTSVSVTGVAASDEPRNTVIPATATETAIPSSTPTPTPAPPTATTTPDAAAAAARTATAQTLVPAQETVVSISTPTPTSTFTPTPTATKTPTPTATRTPSSVPPTPANTATATTAPAPTATPSQGARDAYAWPCAITSIWNMPIGSAASYVAAGIQNANGWNNGEMTTDEEFIGLNPADPLKPLNGAQVHVAPAISWNGSWNGVAAFLSSDGHSVLQGQPLVLSPGGNPSWQYSAPTVDIKGDCIQGAHGGSGLSSFGGALRTGELASSQALRHALKINLYAKRFLSCSSGGYRWPAIRADSYMDCSTYGGAVSQMRMGSLVALRPAEDCASYGSVRARKICQALQDYGAYVVDDTFWDVHAIDIESGAEFSDGGSFDSDLQAMFTHLAVVDNNSPSSIGGGGTPRQPLAPAFSN